MIKLVKDFKAGILSYSEAFTLIGKLKLWGYVLLPGLISIILGVGIWFLAGSISAQATEWILDIYPWDKGSDAVRTVSKILSSILVWVGAFMLYKYIILILVAPFMSPLSEKVENYLLHGHGKHPPFTIPQMLRDMWRGLRISLRNIFREIFYTVILLILGFIPVIGLINSILILAVQAYFAGFGNMDYTLERYFGVRESSSFVKRHKGLAIGNGTLFLVLLAVPVVGLFLAPTLATIAGTIETIERLHSEKGY